MYNGQLTTYYVLFILKSTAVKNVLLFLNNFLPFLPLYSLIGRFRSMWDDAYFSFWIHLTFSLTVRVKDRNSPWHVYLRKTMQLNCIQLAGEYTPWVPNLIFSNFYANWMKTTPTRRIQLKMRFFFSLLTSIQDKSPWDSDAVFIIFCNFCLP